MSVLNANDSKNNHSDLISHDKVLIIELLLYFGADINAKNSQEKTPIMLASPRIKLIFVKELAKLSFESLHICGENLRYLRDNEEL